MAATIVYPSAETFQLDKSQINRYNDEIIAAIFDKVEQDSGYKFSSKGTAYLRKRHSVAFHGWCFQRTGVNRKTPDEDTRRFCDRMEAYDCGGEFKGVLHRDQKWEDRRPQTTLEARHFIETNVDNTTAPALKVKLVADTPDTKRAVRDLDQGITYNRKLKRKYSCKEQEFSESSQSSLEMPEDLTLDPPSSSTPVTLKEQEEEKALVKQFYANRTTRTMRMEKLLKRRSKRGTIQKIFNR